MNRLRMKRTETNAERPSGSSRATAKTVWGFVGTVETALGTVLGTVGKTVGTVGTVIKRVNFKLLNLQSLRSL